MKKLTHKVYQPSPAAQFTLGELAKKLGVELQGDPNVQITGLGTLRSAQPGDITLFTSSQYKAFLEGTQASAVVLSPKESGSVHLPALLAEDPRHLFTQLVYLFYTAREVPPAQHPTAIIGLHSEIHPDSYIGPHCVLGERVKIAAGVCIEAGCYIGDDCEIGEGTVLYPRVTLYHGCKVGKACVLHSGAVIGSDGFGFVKQKARWVKVPQIGGVVIGDRVEIGANTTIDRGAIEDTEVHDDVILDNLIQIAHNVKIGEGTALAACTGVAGSTTIGKHCLVGGGSSFNGHIHITDHVHIVGCSNVPQSIPNAGVYASATTVAELKVWKKNLVRFHQLNDIALRLSELEKKLKIFAVKEEGEQAL